MWKVFISRRSFYSSILCSPIFVAGTGDNQIKAYNSV